MYGWYLTVQFMQALFSARAQLPNVYLVAFCLGNLALNTLNAIWCVPFSTTPRARASAILYACEMAWRVYGLVLTEHLVLLITLGLGSTR